MDRRPGAGRARGTAFGYYNATLGVGALLASLMFGADLDARLARRRRF